MEETRLLVMLADRGVLGADDEADVVASGIRERAQHVIEKRPTDRDHRLEPRVRDGRLLRIDRRALVRLPHARAEPAGEDDGFVGHSERRAEVDGRVIPSQPVIPS